MNDIRFCARRASRFVLAAATFVVACGMFAVPQRVAAQTPQQAKITTWDLNAASTVGETEALNNISGIARDPAGTLWFVADRPRVRIGRLVPGTGTTLSYTEWAPDYSGSDAGTGRGVAVTPSGIGQGDVWVISSGGRLCSCAVRITRDLCG